MLERYFEVIVLGVVQGLTEFLPVSSSGHLAVGQMLLGLREDNLMLSVMLHAGTLVATALYFRARLFRIARDVTGHGVNWRAVRQTEGGQDLFVILLASLPTAVIGLGFKEQVEVATTSPWIVAAGFLATTVLLVSSHFAPAGERRWPAFTGALLVGLAQGFAILPGVSRSGATICVLLWLGVRSARAFELSMLVSLPAVLGAFLFQLKDAVGSGAHAPSLLVGALVAFSVGYGALALLRGVVSKGHLAWFALWVLPLAVITATVIR